MILGIKELNTNYIWQISSEFDELMSLARHDVELANAVTDLLENGLPLVTADVDNLSTSPTGDRVFTYHLPDELKILVATARARKLDTEGVPIGS